MMTFKTLVSAVVAASAIALSAPGCGSDTDAGGSIKCTPGAYVFCRCADRTEATKLCKDDGRSFDACTTNTTGECIGGEDKSDPQTGTEVARPERETPPTPVAAGPEVESCPGRPTALVPGAAVAITGDTTGAKSKFKGRPGVCVVGDGGPEHVYHLQPTGSGLLNLTLKGEGALNALMYLRSACADEESQSTCAPPLGAAKVVQTQTKVVAGRSYFLVVDGASGSAGKYTVTAKLTTGAFCGDGKVSAGEACDDGNNTAGDGCSSDCRAVDGDPTAADCGSPHQVNLWKGQAVSGTGSTGQYGNTFAVPGTSCAPNIGSNLAPDHVYEVTAHVAGTMKVTLTPADAGYNVVLSTRRACSVPETREGMCSNTSVAGAAETIQVPVQTGEKVYVAADGALNAKGSYTIKFELP